MIAFQVRARFSDQRTQKYFIPALTVKIIGAIAVGLIYQFYYGGGKPSGDTFNYFREAGIIYEAFGKSSTTGMHLLLAKGEYTPEIFNYAVKMYWFRSPTEYFVIRIIAVFSLLTFHTYSAIAVIFAAISFSGVWALFKTFYKLFPSLHREFAIAMLFIPSVFFWGSGILKDTITLGALGWATWAIVRVFIDKTSKIQGSIILLLALYTIFSIKIYILLCFVPAAIVWIFIANAEAIRNPLLKIMVLPLLFGIGGVLGYLALIKIGEDNTRYSMETLTQTAEITAIYLARVSVFQEGSGYTLGNDSDFSVPALIKKFPMAVNVTLFRPYLWEVRNPVMLLSALENLVVLFLTLQIFFQAGIGHVFKTVSSRPIITFCLVFAIMFSFAIGVSTYNFGSLVRYKIPMFPFYLSALFIIRYYAEKKRTTKKSRKHVAMAHE